MADQLDFLQLARQRLGFDTTGVSDNDIWQGMNDPIIFNHAFPNHKLNPDQVSQLLAQSRPGPVSSQQIEQAKRNIGLSAISEAGRQALGKDQPQLSGIPGFLDKYVNQPVAGAFQSVAQMPLPDLSGVRQIISPQRNYQAPLGTPLDSREQPLQPFDPTALREGLASVAQNTQSWIPSTPLNPSPQSNKKIIGKFPNATAYTDPGLVISALAEGGIAFANPLQLALMAASGGVSALAQGNRALPIAERFMGNLPQYAEGVDKGLNAAIAGVFGGEGASQVLDSNKPWQERIQGLAPLALGGMGLYSALKKGLSTAASKYAGLDPSTLVGPLRDLNHWEDLLRVRGMAEPQVVGTSDLIKARAAAYNTVTGSDYTPSQYLVSRVSHLDISDSEDPTLKGLTTFQEDGRAVISAFQKADVSTMAHELAHVFRRDLSGDMLSRLEGEFGVENGAWTENHEEMFARGFERYLRDGVAPSEGLSGVFSQFKDWLTKIYQNVSNSSLKKAVGPELKNSLDYLLTGKGPEVGESLDTLTTPKGSESSTLAQISESKTLSQKVAESLKDMFDQKGWSIRRAEQEMGLADNSFGKYLSGERNITPQTVSAITESLGSNLEEFAKQVDYKPQDTIRKNSLAQHSEEDLNDLGFFSKLARQISGTTKDILPADRWLSAIDNPKSGITKEEIKYSGIKDWLKDQGASQISKSQLRDYVVANTVKLEETKGRAYSPDFFEEMHGGVPNFNFEVKNPGSYRDILLKVPEYDGREGIIEKQKQLSALKDQISDLNRSGKVAPSSPELQGLHDQYSSLAREISDLNTKGYNEPHFHEKNVIANLRALDTPLGSDIQEVASGASRNPIWKTEPNAKALEIMEAQSQWEKEGRLSGWRPDLQKELTVKKAKYDSLVERFEREKLDPNSPEGNRILELNRQLNTLANNVDHAPPGPDVPLLQSWKRLVAKRMLRLAAEGGYDQLWLHTGDLVGERYGVKGKENPLLSNLKNELLAAQKVRDDYHMSEYGSDNYMAAQDEVNKLREQLKNIAPTLKPESTWTQKLYDEMLPAELERAGRPFGLEMDRYSKVDNASQLEGLSSDEEVAKDAMGEPSNFRHVIRLSEEQRAAILKEGFPLYQRVGEGEGAPEQSIKDKVRGALRAFAGASPNALLESQAKGIIRQNLGELHQNYQQWKHEFSEARETFLKAPVDLQRAFIQDMQDPKSYKADDPFNPLREWMVQQNPEALTATGRPPSIDPTKAYWSQQLEKYQPVRAALKGMFREEADQISALDPKLQDIWKENYFPNLWENPDLATRVMAQIQGKRPLKGSQGWRRLQKYTLQEGLDKGLKPITNNPIDLAMIHHLESQKFVFGMNIINQLREAGLLKFIKESDLHGASDDWSEVNDHAFVARSFSASEGGMVNRGKYLAPDPVAKILNNYLSPRLYQNMDGWKGYAFDKFRNLGNTLNSFNLGLSGYHATFTTLDVMTSFVGQGMERMLRGDLTGAASEFAQAPISPLLTLRHGFQASKEYLRPGAGGEAYARTVEQLVKAGGRIESDPFYRSNLMNSIYDTAIAKMGKADFIPKLLKGANGAIMDSLVPTYKVGLFHHMMEYQMERLGTDVDPKELQEVGQRTWDTIENRLGQMTHDNLFWNNAVRDLAMASIRSVGWNLGTMRELGGGTVDWARGLAGLVSGAPTKLTARMTYPIALVSTIGLLGAITHYANTGQRPQELKDYFYPSDGRGGRFQFPSYVKELAAMKRAGEDVTKGFGLTGVSTVIGSKLNPALALTAAMISNKDFYNTEIANADHPFVAGYSKYIMEALAPFGMKNAYAKVEPPAEDMSELLANTKDMLSDPEKLKKAGFQLAGAGIPAPAWVDRSPALDLSMRYQQSTSPKEIDEETGLRSRVVNWYAAQLRSGDPKAIDTVIQGLNKGKLSQKQAEKLLERAQEDPLTRSFTYLRSIPQVLSVWKEMTPDEKRTNLPALQKHIMSAYENLRPVELKRIEPRMLDALNEVP